MTETTEDFSAVLLSPELSILSAKRSALLKICGVEGIKAIESQMISVDSSHLEYLKWKDMKLVLPVRFVGDCFAISLVGTLASNFLKIAETEGIAAGHLISFAGKDARLVAQSLNVPIAKVIEEPIGTKGGLSSSELFGFLFPPRMNHPNQLDRLDLIAIFGPAERAHDLRRCLCGLCYAKIYATFENRPKLVKLSSEEILKSGVNLCSPCLRHTKESIHIFGGSSSRQLLSEQALLGLASEVNRSALLDLIVAANKNFSAVALPRDALKHFHFPYDRSDLETLLEGLPKDAFDRYEYIPFQRAVLEDRSLRLAHAAALILTVPVSSILPFALKNPTTLHGRILPLNLLRAVGSDVKPSIAGEILVGSGDKLTDKQLDWFLKRTLNRAFHAVVDIDRPEPKAANLKASLFLLKSTKQPTKIHRKSTSTLKHKENIIGNSVVKQGNLTVQ